MDTVVDAFIAAGIDLVVMLVWRPLRRDALLTAIAVFIVYSVWMLVMNPGHVPGWPPGGIGERSAVANTGVGLVTGLAGALVAGRRGLSSQRGRVLAAAVAAGLAGEAKLITDVIVG